MNKKQLGVIQHYMWSVKRYGIRGIYDAYKNPSGAKIGAYYHIKDRVAEQKGKGYTVMGASCFHFSTGYIIPDENLFIHDTAYGCEAIKISDEQKEELLVCLN
jgi:hypothetical protein